MEKPTLYRKKSIKEIQERQTQSLTTEEQAMVNETISKFFELFTQKHLS